MGKQKIVKTKCKNQSKEKQIPLNAEKTGYDDKEPAWRFNRLDIEYEDWDLDWCEDLRKKLAAFEGQSWREIKQAAGGRGSGTNSHYVGYDNLTDKAQKRFDKLNLDKEWNLFSLRLKGKERIIGYIEDGVMHIIWHDQNHEVVKTTKRNT